MNDYGVHTMMIPHDDERVQRKKGKTRFLLPHKKKHRTAELNLHARKFVEFGKDLCVFCCSSSIVCYLLVILFLS